MTASKPLSADQRAWFWRVLISTYIAYAGFYLVRKAFSISKSTIAKPIEEGGYGFDFDGVAIIWAAFLIAYMLGQFINGYLGRKYGPRVLLLGGLAASMLCNIVFGFSNSFSTFLVFMAFNGLAQSAGWPGVVGSVAEWIRKEERGAVMGFWTSSYVIGNLVVKFFAAFILAHYGVPYAFWGCTLLTFAVWWLVYFWQRNRPEDVGLEPIIDPEDDTNQALDVSEEVRVGFRDYLRILLDPVILLMGCSYFCVKFLRYALDSWLPTFLNIQGLNVANASYYSTLFDLAGMASAVLAGLMLDRVFRGRWERLCLLLSLGMVVGYLCVVQFGGNPYLLALSFGLVGFMLYGPDTIISGTSAVIVAGERNAVAAAGIINGLGSIGPVVQELVIGRMLKNNVDTAIGNANLLGLYMSGLFFVFMLLLTFVIHRRHKRLGTG